MTLKQDMKVYYETFPESLYHCDFCTRNFRTVAGLHRHITNKHGDQLAARIDSFQEWLGEQEGRNSHHE